MAVLDFGGLSIGDPTIDLVVAWRLACGWELVLSVMGLPYYWDTMRDRCLRGLYAGRAALAELTSSWTTPGPSAAR